MENKKPLKVIGACDTCGRGYCLAINGNPCAHPDCVSGRIWLFAPQDNIPLHRWEGWPAWRDLAIKARDESQTK